MTKSIEENFGGHCIRHIKSSKLHAVCDSFDFKLSDNVTPDFGNDGYTYLLQYQFNELDEAEMLAHFFFKSSEDCESFKQANVECGVEYFLANRSYDDRLHELCMMISK
ncbi:hypothetical protein Plhal703r1_c13g0066581 [Plasmopara halstedii]